MKVKSIKQFSLLEIYFNKDMWVGVSFMTIESDDDIPRSFFMAAKAFDGCWYIDILWARITPRWG